MVYYIGRTLYPSAGCTLWQSERCHGAGVFTHTPLSMHASKRGIVDHFLCLIHGSVSTPCLLDRHQSPNSLQSPVCFGPLRPARLLSPPSPSPYTPPLTNLRTTTAGPNTCSSLLSPILTSTNRQSFPADVYHALSLCFARPINLTVSLATPPSP